MDQSPVHMWDSLCVKSFVRSLQRRWHVNFRNVDAEALAADPFRPHKCEKQIGDDTFLIICHMHLT